MALDKAYFDDITIEIVKKKYYNANKVDAMLADIRRQALALTEDNRKLRQRLDVLTVQKDEIGETLLSARTISRQLVEDASRRAHETTDQAEAEADKTLQKASEQAEETRRTAEAEAQQRLAGVDEQVRQTLEDAEARSKSLLEQAEETRRTAEAEAQQCLTEAEEQARQTLEDAEARAKSMLEQAEKTLLAAEERERSLEDRLRRERQNTLQSTERLCGAIKDLLSGGASQVDAEWQDFLRGLNDETPSEENEAPADLGDKVGEIARLLELDGEDEEPAADEAAVEPVG